MSFVPLDELKQKGNIPLAPMVDFLFLMLAFFATMAVTQQMTSHSTKVELVKAKGGPSPFIKKNEDKMIHITVLETGEYKWVTSVKDYPMRNATDIADELKRQYQKGLLPEKKEKTHILLKIDKKARWDPILKALLAIREAGFDARPVYEVERDAGRNPVP